MFYASSHFDGPLESWWQSYVEVLDGPVSAGCESVEAPVEATYKQFSGCDLVGIARVKFDLVRKTTR